MKIEVQNIHLVLFNKIIELIIKPTFLLSSIFKIIIDNMLLQAYNNLQKEAKIIVELLE
jgi:hypothetical protein